MLNPTIFRENDIRGIAERDLTSEGVEHLGLALGTYFQRNAGPNVNIGRDCRLSGDRLNLALRTGLIASGCHVTDLGVVPTPVTYFSAMKMKADGAVMITGSHNPKDYNGFKSVCGEGSLHGHAIQDLLHLIQNRDYATGQGSYREIDIVDDYVDAVVSGFSFPRRIKVVVDAGNGTAGPVMEKILAKLNVESTNLYFDMDGTFPNHHPDPTVMSNLTDLVAKIRETGAELGIGFDGDSDRIGTVDENGEPVYGDMLMLAFAREILTRKPGATFIGEVKCSQVMYDELARLGGRPIMWKTGHSLIKTKMKDEKADLAGEMSGHMFFADRYFGYDDALYAACRIMEIVSKSGQPLSHQFDGLPKLVSTPEIRLEAHDETKFDVVARVAAHFTKTRKIVDVDGARVIFPKGWGLVRASNTQPVLVMRFEAESQALLDEYRAEVEEVLIRETGAPLHETH
ncbi:MAG: phosphomannomutase/phosphoglucomutase [Acidobacteria bacterium]|nr:phosphomannomutase/phosphoglucomutase [Acidobacteriota bacterium]